MTDDRSFITGVLREMEGNALLMLSSGRSEPTDKAPHGKLRVDVQAWFSYPAELGLMVAFAEKARADQRDAYISPIIYGDAPFVNGKGQIVPKDRDGRPLYTRGLRNALFAQTIYMDSDTCPPEAFRLPPSRHVTTSEGHGHDYWFLPEPVPAGVAAQIAHKITTAHKADGCDPSGWSANKVLRLPTFNTTYDELDPFEVTWEDDDVDPQTGEVGVPKVYDVLVLEEVYSDIEVDRVEAEDGYRDLPPVPPIEGLPDFESLAQRIPATQKRLNDLLYKVPKAGDGGWQSEQRFALLLDLQRFGFNDEETISLAWHSPAASKWRVDKRGVSGLWWELQVKVKPIIAEESGAAIEAAPATEVRLDRRREAPRLLSPAQRDRVLARQDLVTLYLAYGRSKVNVFNAPYQTINAWTLMSLGLAEAAELPKEPRPLGLGIYTFTLGNSSSGKDESKSLLSACVRKLYPHDDPDIPASSSREDLIQNLISRDDKVTYLQSNEADGLLSQIKQGGYSTGIVQYWTLAYDGEVPSLGRVGRQELKQPGKHAIPVMHLMGTPAGILEVLDPKMFYSGYLARQIWVIGDDNPTTKQSLTSKFRRGAGDRSKTYDGVPAFFGSMFAGLRSQLRRGIPLDQKRASLEPTDEAIELHSDAMWKVHEHFAKEHDVELWKPVLRRLADIVWKIAGLSAAMNGRTVVGTFDVEVALFYTESWVANAMTVADGISETYFSKQCDEIEKFIYSRESKRAELGAIYRFRKSEPKRVVDEYLNSLTFQGRIEQWQSPDKGGPSYYRIKEKKAS